ncbi:MAG: hypothetical protein A2Z24_01135 [Candidatus Woykebacteria bacterium RBG_16_44_10]|uniref:Uncharacterized protein n=1 Tax=Candidatus Woykebacteria bacterium RBG_16_44_10 TaxID=1802597 RepID=A0A1G1WFY5_9BACT|nr:MAG: hypothetical protein A2Z24_01135 [Candidatus Woykebacteria bacterium RBG_16_44_10]
MQLPDSLEKTNDLIAANLEEAKRIQAKLDSGTINPWSRKRARLEERMARLFELNQALTNHQMDLVRWNRIPFSPPEPHPVPVSTAH